MIIDYILFIILIIIESIFGEVCSKDILESIPSPNNEYVLNTYLNNCGATTPFVVTGELCNKNNKCKEIYFSEHENKSEVYWIDNITVSINSKVLNIKKDKYNSIYDEN